jgi:hypothetical protein
LAKSISRKIVSEIDIGHTLFISEAKVRAISGVQLKIGSGSGVRLRI